MQKKVLVINAGSSSIKFSLFIKDTMEAIASGLAERIGLDEGHIEIKFNGKYEENVALPNHKFAVKKVYSMMEQYSLIESPDEVEYIGFRVVQGGEYFSSTAKITEKEIALIKEVAIFAPLHNPGAVQAMNAFKEVFPNAKLSADFDTAFHTTIDKVNAAYPIENNLVKKLKIKKYGAHGISHEFITRKLSKILNKDKVTFINLHIGNGASICAIKDSKSFDTSMGLTPLAGIMMGTRSGDIDPSIHNFVCEQTGMSISEFTDLLNKKSGLLGVSGISSDMRDVQNAALNGDKQAQFALDVYAQKIADYTANYFNKLGGKIDGIVFTAGVGENAAAVRKSVIDKLFFRHIELDDEKNLEKYGDYNLISTKNSEIPVYVIRTNEELVIAQNAIKIYEEK